VFESVLAEISSFLVESIFSLAFPFQGKVTYIVHKKSNESFLCEQDSAANILDHV
jgi:hypothetical protein